MAAKAAGQDMQAMFAAFTAFMAQQQEAHEATIAPKAAVTRKRTNTPRGTSARKLNAERQPKGTTPTRTTPKAAKGAITCEQAWKALGADPTYTPSQPTAPARNSQLWALNAAGKLRLI